VDRDIADYVRAKGYEPATILVLPEKRLGHADRDAHHRDGVAMRPEQYRALPLMIAKPEAVYWARKEKRTIYVYPDIDEKRCILIVADMPAQKKDAPLCAGPRRHSDSIHQR
jgi:hypothetical protein